MKIIIVASLSCAFLAESAQIGPFPGAENSLWNNEIESGPSEGVALSILFNQMGDGSFEGGPFSHLRPKCADKSKPTCVCNNRKVIVRYVNTF